MDDCLDREDMNCFRSLFGAYLDKIRYRAQVPVSDYDLVFGNIIVDKEGRWNLIDYEWTFEECVDSNALAFRALYCYQMGDGKRKGLPVEEFLKELGISEAAQEYRARERRFQKAVTGNRVFQFPICGCCLAGGRSPWQEFFQGLIAKGGDIRRLRRGLQPGAFLSSFSKLSCG